MDLTVERGDDVRLHHVQVAWAPGTEEAVRRFYRDGLGKVEVEKPEAMVAELEDVARRLNDLGFDPGDRCSSPRPAQGQTPSRRLSSRPTVVRAIRRANGTSFARTAR